MRRILMAVGLVVGALVAATVPPAAATVHAANAGATNAAAATSAPRRQLRLPDPPAAKHSKNLAAGQAVSASGGVPSGDEIVTATADTDGYHLFAASSGDGWKWHALATLQPGGYSEEPWIGEHCTTGDGRYVVAVVAPWSANNSAAGIAAGGIGYAVDAHTGAVRPLAAGLMLSYFNPGCGTGSNAALSRYADIGQSSTQILTVDATNGRTAATPIIPNQVTSAIPVDGTLYAADGHRLVRINPNGSVTALSVHGGPVFGLTPGASGSVDYLAQDTAAGANPTTGVYRLAGGKAVRVASGALKTVRLLPGIGGADSILGASGAVADRVRAPGLARGLSTDSFAEVSAQGTMAAQSTSPRGTARLVSVSGAATGGGRLPAPAAATRTLPTASTATADATNTSTTSARSGRESTAPTCAVPRNDPAYQVPQPSSRQIDWALNLAGQYGLPVRSSAYANLNTGQYDPSADFPLPAGFDGTTGIPRQIMEGIFAQESNWKQASPHAPAGLSGNPLIADYYGIYSRQNTSGAVDFSLADCGYGLGQITDMMRLAAPGDAPSPLQKRVALDYTENAAVTAQTLADKWDQLSAAGITIGDDKSMEIENWYFAIWAYNSGINPQASTGNTTGCTPGPSCADSAGNWGLGWTNNPVNPTYDPARHPFLHDDLGDLTYGDAATPQKWPYQEKVFGWIESGQYESDGVTLKYSPTYDYTNGNGYFLDLPLVDAFCDSSDDCDPLASQPCGHNADSDPLQWHCWWHKSLTGGCLGGCHTGDWDYDVNQAEPAAANPFPSICAPPGDFTDTLIVDDNVQETNLAGCSGTPPADSAMLWIPNNDSAGGPFGDVDLHQLGTGYGGRTMFTHLEPPSAAQWGGTMIWSPGTLDYDVYDVEVFIPTLGAAGDMTYTINSGTTIAANTPAGQAASTQVTINQNDYGNQWVSLGTYYLAPGANVTATNVVSGGDGATDVAFDAVAFRPVSSYVSLGDSYSSGEGTGSYDSGTDVAQANQCHRSPNSYARVWAAAHGASGVPIVQLACSGAVTTHLTTAGQWNEPAQIPATPRHAIKVFLTIGGNDAGFAAVITRCATPGLTCEDYYTQDDGNNEDAVIDGLAPTLTATYTQLQQRAPGAQITALTYPDLFEPESTCPEIANIPVDDVEWLTGEAFHLDDVVMQAAQDAGIQALDERYAFAGHELCTGSGQNASWVYSLPIPWPSGSRVTDSSAWFHPTINGQGQLAQDLATHLNTSTVLRPRATLPGWMPRNIPFGIASAADARTWLPALPTSTPPATPYDSTGSQFGSDWSVSQGCKTRQWILRRDALKNSQAPPQVLVPQPTGCPITQGSWESAYELNYTLLSYTSAAQIDGAVPGVVGMQIDHVVPKADAWNSGASLWSPKQRRDFANDRWLPELLSVSQTINGSKNDRTPDQWLPPNQQFICTYARMWVTVKRYRTLGVTNAERTALNNALAGCT